MVLMATPRASLPSLTPKTLCVSTLSSSASLSVRTPFTASKQPNSIPQSTQQPQLSQSQLSLATKTPSKSAFHSLADKHASAHTKSHSKHVVSCPQPQSGLKAKTPSRQCLDRFIPNRVDKSIALHAVSNSHSCENAPPSVSSASPSVSADYSDSLASSLLGDEVTSKILTFKHKAPQPLESHNSQLRAVYAANKENGFGLLSNANQLGGSGPKSRFRAIASTPERVLDAPDLTDDYYLNLLEWSSQNTLAVALGNAVYLWHAQTGSIEQLCESTAVTDESDAQCNAITSLSWMHDGTHLAVSTGGAQADVQLWNVAAQKQVRSMKGHSGRIGALAWNGAQLSSGSRDSQIHHHDVRIAQHHTHTLNGHEQEICGLKWSHDGTQLASGSNDNTCRIWDASSSSARHVLTDSCAAVKALAWCPWQKHLLATGSGTADRHIRFYNTQTGTLANSIDSGSQVCSLQWSRHEKELLSSHGFSQNQLSVWKYPSLVKIADLTGHQSRVLHTAVSPCGDIVCSAAADETIRFWRVWDGHSKSQGSGSQHSQIAQQDKGKHLLASIQASQTKRQCMSIR